MRARLIQLIVTLSGSYWFVPSLMVLAAIVVATGAETLDRIAQVKLLADVPWLNQNQPQGARAVLSAIATSMIGVAGVTFSMTILTVSFAASNIGPRLIGDFMRDRGNQITLGTFIATFVYCLLVMRTITDGTNGEELYIPHISILVALVLAMFCIANLIYFIHHIPESINVERITHRLGRDLQESIQALFPENLGEAGQQRPPEFDTSFRRASKSIEGRASGYVQVIDEETLMKAAREHDLTLRLEYRPGDFVQRGRPLLYAHPRDRVNSEAAEALCDCIVVGTTRTAHQNALFLVDQLVEIIMRALSPGVNDPFTAVACLDWLQPALASALQNRPPEPARFDADGNLRIVVHPTSFAEFAEAVFGRPLQYVAGDRTAAFRAIEVLAELVTFCRDDAQKSILIRHAKLLRDATSQCLPVDSDRAAMAQRYDLLVRLAEDPSFEQTMREGGGWPGGRG